MVKVDASESGVGAVLSQQFGEKAKMFPVAYFLWKLSRLSEIIISGTENYWQ